MQSMLKIIPWYSKKSRAFTLIETVIALGITVSIMLLGSFYLKSYQETISLSEYQAEICSDLRYAMRYATIKSEKVEMMVLDDQIYFRPRIIKENLLAPKGVTLSLTMDHKIVIKDDGMVNANNIYLHSSHEEKVIHLQLGWGQLIYES